MDFNYAEKKYGNGKIGKIAHGKRVFPTQNGENISQRDEIKKTTNFY